MSIAKYILSVKSQNYVTDEVKSIEKVLALKL